MDDLKPLYEYVTSTYYIGTSKKTSDEVVKNLQKALDSMKKDGTFKKVVQKWMKFYNVKNWLLKDGVLQVVAMQFRTQKANREDALQRFISLLSSAIKEKPRRKKTRVPRKAKEARLQAKKQRSQLKAVRSKQDW